MRLVGASLMTKVLRASEYYSGSDGSNCTYSEGQNYYNVSSISSKLTITWD